MLITAALLYAYNGIEQKEDETSQQLIAIHIGTAQQIISNYVLFDCETVLTDSEHYDAAAVAMFKNVCLRIATLLQLEDGGNIGVNNNSSIGVNRTFANIVDYTPYLKPLSAFRKIEGA
jgi:hypothetical protein